MKAKFIVFDIDGTLLTTDMKFLDSTKQALASLRENGHAIGIATGRDYASAIAIIEELEMDTYVLCNGSVGYVRHELAYEVKLSKESIKRLIEIATENNDQIVFQTANGLKRHFEEPGESLTQAYESLGWPIPDFDDMYWNQNPIIQAMLFCKSEDLHKYEIHEFRYVSWHKFGLDVIPKDGSKAKTILKIAEKNGFQHEDIVFFGDGMNDIELIELSGIGIAMGNAEKEVKDKADLITDSCNEHGIYNALKRLSFI
ncbi:Cof-type HAD-IIB family hydrolase [Paenibacillus sp. 1011MAR3C5]|uniref:Cof-type HAD-IIB family hydrolase n=1 Tax=Paenibacillus sp. 1011MAR3C5 TaxID=1675787 RepID=UPI000E6D1942|nr:Cof-type HAD-IIB family hydrolase [Paenibacillus sp. 1011MAR3C5]RJE90414.1 Cof-type HAD-IIB family hydrolase [Paenibacillus sp. 1011MAR3C5]